jgi:superfamily II DNA or RNA helicase
MNRTARQKQCANAWRDNKAIGTIVAPTGFGKTRLTLEQIIGRMFAKKAKHVLILVHRDKLKKQWKSSIENLVEKKLQKFVEVETVQWFIANNASVMDYDLLIVDEIHKFYGEEYIKFINGERIPTKWRLGLTATPNNREGIYPIDDIYPIVDSITQEEAIENGWISQFIEFNLPVKLTPEEMEQYKHASDLISNNRSKFPEQNNFNAMMKCLHGDNQYSSIAYATMWAHRNGWTKNADKDSDVHRMWNPNVIISYAKKCMEGYRIRKNVIQHAANKYQATIELLQKFANLKTICFSESTVFANDLARKFDKVQKDQMVVFHTQLPSRPLKDDNGDWILYKSGAKKGEKRIFGIKLQKDIIIDLFVNNRRNVRVLSTAKVFDEGFDCPDIQMGIITSRTKNPNQQIQRGGRVKRVIAGKENDKMLIVNIYCENTDDKFGLVKAQSNYEHDVHWVQSIEDISIDFEEGIDFNNL